MESLSEQHRDYIEQWGASQYLGKIPSDFADYYLNHPGFYVKGLIIVLRAISAEDLDTILNLYLTGIKYWTMIEYIVYNILLRMPTMTK